MKLSIDRLFEKFNRLEIFVNDQREEINELRIENLFLKERVHNLKKAAEINKREDDKGERAADYEFSSKENFSR